MAREPGIETGITTDNSQFDASLKKSGIEIQELERKLNKFAAAGGGAFVKMSKVAKVSDVQRAAFDKLSNSLAQLENQYLSIGDRMSRSAQRLTENSRAFRIMRGQMYNSSVQLQDFAVQVGAGTSAMTAFSQNAPQFLSFFGPKAALIGAVIAALPLLKIGIESLVGPSFDAADSIKTLTEATDAYTEAVKRAARSSSELYEEFGAAGPVMGKFYKEFEAIAKLDLETKLASVNQELSELMRVGGSGYSGAAVSKFFDLSTMFSLLKETRVEARGLVSEFQEAQKQLEKADGNTEAQLQALLRLNKAASAAAREKDGVSEKEQELLDLLQKQLELTARKYALETSAGQASAKERLAAAAELADAELRLGEQLQDQLREKALEKHKAEQAAIKATEAHIQEMIKVFRAAQKRMRDEDIAATERSLDALFKFRTLYYSVRFADEESVMSQPVKPDGGKLNPGASYEELLGMGWTPEDLANIGLTAPKGGAGATDQFATKLEQLREYLMTEEELERQSYENRMLLLEEFLQRQPEMIAEYNQLKEDLQRDHQNRLAEIDVYAHGTALQKMGNFMGLMGDALQSGNSRMFDIAQKFGAASALINAWTAYSQMLAAPSNFTLGQKLAAAMAVLKAGLGAMNAIKGASPDGGGSGGGGATAGGGAVAPTVPTQVVRLNLQGDMFSRASVEGLLEQIQSQLDRGGRLVFE